MWRGGSTRYCRRHLRRDGASVWAANRILCKQQSNSSAMPPKKVSQQPTAESMRVMRTLFKDLAKGVRDIKSALDVSTASGPAAPKPRAKAKARHHAVGAAVQLAQQAAQIAAMTHANGNPYHEVSEIFPAGHAAAGGDGPGSDHEEAAPVRRRLTGKQAPPPHLAVASSAAAGASAATRRRYSTKQAPRG